MERLRFKARQTAICRLFTHGIDRIPVAIMREISFAGAGAEPPVVPPKLGVDAGALGAIALAAGLA